jgi:hypothetical protein
MQPILRPHARILVGLAAAAGAFGVAAVMSAASAPTARADDLTDVINAVDGDLTLGQTDFSTAFADFGGGDVNDGLAAFYAGVDNDFVSAPDNLYVGSLDLLANDPVVGSLTVSLAPESNFTTGLNVAEAFFTAGEPEFTSAATDLSAGDYAGAAYLDSLGSLYDVLASQFLLEGVVASF